MVVGGEGHTVETGLSPGSVAEPQGQGKVHVTLETEWEIEKILWLV